MNKRLLIVCQNFPPNTATSSFRPYAWAKYLSKFNWDVTVICKGEESKEYFIFDKVKVIVVQCGLNIPTKLSLFFQKNNLRILGNLFSLFHTFFENSFWYNSLKPIYRQMDKYANNNRDAILLVTARPFILFNYGYLINKKYQTKWVADYRDDWSTTELFQFDNIKFKSLINYLLKRNGHKEKKWVGSAHSFTSVSPYYVRKINNFLEKKVKGVCIENGYFEDDFCEQNIPINLYDKITFTYIGACYPSQDFKLLFVTIKEFMERYNINIELKFVGTKFSSYLIKLIDDIFGANHPIIQVPRVSKDIAIQIQKSSHALFMLPHKNVKGVPSSKIYEYLMAEKPILLCPSDNDIMDEIVTNTRLGFLLTADIERNVKVIYDIIEKYMKSENPVDVNYDALKQYSRKAQTVKLNEILNGLS